MLALATGKMFVSNLFLGAKHLPHVGGWQHAIGNAFALPTRKMFASFFDAKHLPHVGFDNAFSLKITKKTSPGKIMTT